MAINTDKYFFWAKGASRAGTPFWWIILSLFLLYIPFIRPWWWIFLPLFLSIELRKLYMWWIGWDFAYAQVRWVVLELIPPKEVLVPIKAMEDVYSTMWNPLFDAGNFRERYCEGMLEEWPNWMSFELVSIEGKIHFYVRLQAAHRVAFESALYSHYPEIEVQQVPDYAKDVPQTVPNSEWDMYGEDYVLGRPSPYPMRTYEEWFEPQGEKISAEEKRIDPINSLLESMSRLKKGEQYWVQIILHATGMPYETGFKKEAEEIISKIAKRPGPPKKQGAMDEIMEVMHMLLAGPQKVGEGEKATYKWASASAAKSESGERELLLTPGERVTVTSIENKVKKPIFRTVLRGIYIAKRENWNAIHKSLFRAYVAHFYSESANFLTFDKNTRTKVHYLFRKRRVFLRARRMMRNAVLRFPPYFPERSKGSALLSAEELTTIFHFPVRISSLAFPTVERVEHRKGGPPPNLPVSGEEE